MFSRLKSDDICKVPSSDSIVYKDECLYCFDSTDSQFGLFISMTTFIGVCKQHLDLFYRKSQNRLYLNIKIEKRYRLADGDSEIEEKNEYKKLLNEAFKTTEFDCQEKTALFLMPENEEFILSQSNDQSKECELSENLKLSIKRILSADSLAKSMEKATQMDKWDGNYMQESKFARGLKQLNNGVKVTPSGWKCCYCDLRTNLWMNLTDGTILCGRKFFDGSGGNNHAIEYFTKTQYPLAVKLGTITPSGADIFSYIEDDMVIDPLLGEHLAHFGIDIMKMEKTDKSIEELTVDRLKLNREQMAIMEAGCNQELLSGAGLCGIVNIGNSCYMNSVLQVLLSLPSFLETYSRNYLQFISGEQQQSVMEDVGSFRCQMAKLGYYLQSNQYCTTPSPPSSPKNGDLYPSTQRIVPQLLKYIIGKGHADFSTKQQQDSFEYLIHVLNMMKADHKKYNITGESNPLESVAFRVEERIECHTTGTAKYQSREELVLSLAIPLEQAVYSKQQQQQQQQQPIIIKEEEEIIRPVVTLQSCLDLFTKPNEITDYNVNGKRGTAFQSSKLETFPQYLWLHVKRFTVGEDWTPKKLDVEIEVPDTVDLSHMAAKGLRAHRVPMKEEQQQQQQQVKVDNNIKVELNIEIINELLSMGFSENACRKAVYLTGNKCLEEAANWLMVHIGDADFEEPAAPLLQLQLNDGRENIEIDGCGGVAEERDVKVMVSMGFTEEQAKAALRETGGSLERAADWAFGHPEEMEAAAAAAAAVESMECDSSLSRSVEEESAVGETKYTLCALISHMGNNAHVGHYVCHIKQSDGSWVLFNDDVVQRSVSPPKKFAYLYLFKRDN